MPEIVIVDEIGTEAEALACRTIAERGVQLIGTAHGQTLENLIKNPTLTDLIGGIQSVTLGKLAILLWVWDFIIGMSLNCVQAVTNLGLIPAQFMSHVDEGSVARLQYGSRYKLLLTAAARFGLDVKMSGSWGCQA